MRKGDPKRLPGWCGMLLCLAALCLAMPCLAAAWDGQAHGGDGGLVLQRLAAGDLPADEVLSGRHDHRLEPAAGTAIRGRRGDAGWWRVTSPAPVHAAGQPRLVLRSPFLARVEAWAPGADAPRHLAVYGANADLRYSHRALVVDLPQGIPAGRAVWLRVEPGSWMQMPVAIESLDQVHREDLAFVAWRVFILSVLTVLALLAIAFRAGTGDASFGWFGAMLGFAVLYLVAIGGDARMLPGAEAVFGESTRANRIAGGLGVLCSNLFQRAYLDLPGKLPRLDRLLWVGSGLAASTGLGSLVSDIALLGHVGNLGLLLSALLLLAASALLALRGDRAGRVVMASWLPLMAFATLMATEMMGLWAGPTWLAQGLAGAFAVAGLLLMIGLADKLLELRRDRDHASAAALSDDLTGLYNRSGVEAELARAMQLASAAGTPLSIAFVDVDNFKAINDRHGHSVGDRCLRIVSQRLRNELRAGGIIGRYGGDEFLVVLPGSPLREALEVARRMVDSVGSRPLSVEALELDGSLSVGVAEYCRGESAEMLFERADAALYASKQGGRNRVSGTGRAPAGVLAG